MKQLLRVSMVAGLMTLGFASQALAVPSLQIVACQGTVCGASVITTPGPINFSGATIGDYNVSGSGAAFESAGQSQAAQTTINVTRTGSSQPGVALEVYVVATGYNLPNPPGTLSTTHTASFSDFGAVNAASGVSFQGWINVNNNGLGGGVPAGGGAFVGPATIPILGTTTNGVISCTPSGGGNPQSCNVNGASVPVAGGSIPFSLITRTTFNIPVSGIGDLYGSSSQVTVFPGSVVPEPASMLLLGTGLLGLARAARRRAR